MKLTIVVVLYKQKVEESKTFSTLKQTLSGNNLKEHTIELLLYDNSPEKQGDIPYDLKGVHVTYLHDHRNLGIAVAYNLAWTLAREKKSEWLLLLDHDTELTEAYFERVLNMRQFAKNIAAAVPKIYSDNTMISPVNSRSLRPLQENRPTPGIQEEPVMAINSGTLVHVDFLNKIGGFNEEFPLDFLDHWMFDKIYKEGYKVWLMDVSLEHELSVMDYSRVSLERYKSIMHSENLFYSRYKNELFTAYKIQLIKRFFKQAIMVKNKRIALYTLKKLFSM